MSNTLQESLDLLVRGLEKVIGQRANEVEIDAPISRIGLDSLEAIEWAMEIEELSGAELDLVQLKSVASLRALAMIVSEKQRTRSSNPNTAEEVLAPGFRQTPAPASFGQEAMLRHCLQAGPAYVLNRLDRISGPLNVPVLRECLGYIIARHEILRTTFDDAEGRPVQIVHPPEPASLQIFDHEQGANTAEEAAQLIKAEATRIADPNRGPLIRFSLLRVSENEWWLVRVCHHLIWDDVSSRIFLDELGSLYESKLRGESSPLPPTEPLQYADYASWQQRKLHRNGSAYQGMIRWWQSQLGEELATFELPFRRPVPQVGLDPMEGVITWTVNSELTERLNRLGRSENVTSYKLWLAALVAVLAALTGTSNILVGTYMTSRREPALRNLIGYFTNVVALPFRCQLAKSFRAWLSEVGSFIAAAQDNGEITLEEVRRVLRDLNVFVPEIQIIFGAPTGDRRSSIHFANLELSKVDPSTSTMPWGFTINPQPAQHICRTSFNAELYDPMKVRKFVEYYLEFLDSISRSPELPMSTLLGEDKPVRQALGPEDGRMSHAPAGRSAV